MLHGVADDRELRLRGFSPVKDAQSGSSCRKAQNFWPEKFQKATTAVALNEGGRRELTARLGGMLSAPVLLEERVDAGLIGGLVLRIGDTLLDGSVRGRLEQMRRQVLARGEHEIQGGRDFLAD